MADEISAPVPAPSFEPPVETFTDEEIEEFFSQIDGAVILINDFCANSESKLVPGITIDHIKERVKTNYKFIENKQYFDWYKDDNRNKTTYDNAVTAGKNFVGT